MASDDGQQPSEEPDYKVYRSKRGLRSRLPSADLSSLRDKARAALPGRGPGKDDRSNDKDDRPSLKTHRSGGGIRWKRWLIIVPVVWIFISFLAFAVSAQLQSTKLADSAKATLGGNPFILASPQTILVIGTDARDPKTKEPGAETRSRCIDQQAHGDIPNSGCPGFRADTLMLVRAGGGKFHKLSVPRDSFAEIPGNDPQKINAGYAYGGAGLEVRTVENFLNIDIDHVVIIDFTGFEDFINAIGGVKIDLPHKLCADIAGGAGGGQGGISLRLEKGENTLDGGDALAYSRVRKLSSCPGKGKSEISFGNYDDLDRAAAQQNVLNGIKSRLTSPLRLPYNFIKGPIIGWSAPKAFVSDMGALSMPQLVLSTAVAGSGSTDVLCAGLNSGCGAGPDGSIEVPDSERRRAVKALQG